LHLHTNINIKHKKRQDQRHTAIRLSFPGRESYKDHRYNQHLPQPMPQIRPVRDAGTQPQNPQPWLVVRALCPHEPHACHDQFQRRTLAACPSQIQPGRDASPDTGVKEVLVKKVLVKEILVKEVLVKEVLVKEVYQERSISKKSIGKRSISRMKLIKKEVLVKEILVKEVLVSLTSRYLPRRPRLGWHGVRCLPPPTSPTDQTRVISPVPTSRSVANCGSPGPMPVRY
jgi:hypothetical protein